MTPQARLELQVLEFINDNDQGFLNEPANLGEMYEKFGDETTLMAGQSLTQRGLIKTDGRLSGGYHITAEGRQVIEELREMQSDRSRRRLLCREQLLTWLDANTDHRQGRRVGPSDFDGEADLLPFDGTEVAAAVDYLESRVLIKTIRSLQGIAAMWITDAGREAIDAGGVDAAERAERTEPSVSQVFNMGGSGNTFATATAPGSSATANVTNFNLDHAKVFAAAVRASDLDLSEDDEQHLLTIEEADETADLTRTQRATAAIYEVATKSSTTAMGAILTLLGKKALGLDG